MQGWESVEAHMKFRETPLFAENVGLIRFKRGDAEMVRTQLSLILNNGSNMSNTVY